MSLQYFTTNNIRDREMVTRVPRKYTKAIVRVGHVTHTQILTSEFGQLHIFVCEN